MSRVLLYPNSARILQGMKKADFLKLRPGDYVVHWKCMWQIRSIEGDYAHLESGHMASYRSLSQLPQDEIERRKAGIAKTSLRIPTIRAIRAATGCSLRKASSLVRQCPLNELPTLLDKLKQNARTKSAKR